MNHNKKLTSRAQELRRNMTLEERKLWYEYLRKYPIQFRRQVTFGNYIADFYCAAAKMVIELDGPCHKEPERIEYDERRTRFFEQNGICVVRYGNMQVLKYFDDVCRDIDKKVMSRMGI